MKTNASRVRVPAGLVKTKQIIKIMGALQKTLLPPTIIHLLKLEFMLDTVPVTVA
jgi:hypothetical protein